MNKQNPIHILSAVVPVHNEAAGISLFFDLLLGELKKLDVASYEIVFVNDGSTDSTAAELEKIQNAHQDVVKVFMLTRNFGKEAALSAGLHNASGDCIVTLDADGQHPPVMIADLLKVYADGYDMVVGMRTLNVDEKYLKKLGNKVYYKLLKLSGIGYLQPRVTDFRVMSREVVDEFCTLTERRRITRGLLDWMGYHTGYIEFEAPERLAGKATYNLKKLAYLAIDSILSNSRKPLAISFAIGSFVSLVGFFGSTFIILEDYVLNDPLDLRFSGSTLLVLMTLFMIGLVLVSQGIASLYLARIYEEAQQRPLYIINKATSSKKRQNKEK